MSNSFYTSIAPYYDDIFPLQKPMVEFFHRRTNESVNVLDVGCATGQITAAIAPKCNSIQAFDLDQEMVTKAKQRLDGFANVSVRQGDMLKMTEEPNMFAKKTQTPNKISKHGVSQRLLPGDQLTKFSTDEINAEGFLLIMCVGNTLVHLPDEQSIAVFIKHSYDLLQIGGILIIQILNYQYVLKNNLTRLPLIDNDRVRFVREYDFLENGYVRFNTKLHIKQSEKVISNSSILLCLSPKKLYQMLSRAGFYHIYSYESWSEMRVSNSALPLIVEAIKT